jgi:hypothetical protein
VSDETPTLFDEIRQLLAAPRSGADAPGRERLEHTLTTGYARALALEAEQQRIERRLECAPAAERPRLAERLVAARAEHSSLRCLLQPLRVRARERRLDESRALTAL